MLCDELWMMCVKIHQQDLLLEAARHALQRSAMAQRPRQLRAWQRVLRHARSGCRALLSAFSWPRQRQPADAAPAPWTPVEELTTAQAPHHDLAVAMAQPVRVPPS